MVKRWYDSPRWRKARLWFLSENPLCAICDRSGLIVPATIVDHIIPHEGNYDKFWDSENNWQGVCATCHSGVKRIADNHGYSQSAGADGIPLDPDHPWNKW